MTGVLWRRLRADLVRSPRPHGEVLSDRTVGPLELFYDLVVVVLVAQAARHLAEHLTVRRLGDFAVLFAVVWIAWLNGTLHHELHGREDVRSRLTFLGQLLLLVPLGVYVPDASGVHGRAFGVTAALLFGYLTVLWWRAGRGDTPEFAAPSRIYVGGTALCAVMLAASTALGPDGRLVAWALMGCVYLGVVAVVMRVASPQVADTIQVTHALAERFGAFVIIVLGETVTGVVTGLSVDPTDPMTLAVGLTAVLVGFGSWWTYFDFVGHREVRRTRAATTIWLLGHLPITVAVAAMGATMVTLVDHASVDRTSASASWMLCGGAALILATVVGVMTALRDWREERDLFRQIAVACLLAGLFALAMAPIRPPPLVLGVSLVATFGAPWTFAVLRRASLAGPTDA